MKDQEIRILVADDHSIFRQGLANVINNEGNMRVVGEACDGQEAIELARRLQPQVVVMDLNMPKMNGVEATRIIAGDFPETMVIGLSMCSERELWKEMLAAGATDFVSKSEPVDAILKAIRKAALIGPRMMVVK